MHGLPNSTWRYALAARCMSRFYGCAGCEHIALAAVVSGSSSPELRSWWWRPHSDLIGSCDVIVFEWESGSYSARRPPFAGVSQCARFLLSPPSSLFQLGRHRLFIDYNTCSKPTYLGYVLIGLHIGSLFRARMA